MIIFYFFIFAFGTCIGSFLNAWIWRLHRGESIYGRRSYCPKCAKQLKNFDLVPVFSFLFLGGKCRFCKKKISLQYPLVELCAGALYLIAFITVIERFFLDGGWQIYLLLYWYFIAVLIVVFVFDLKYYKILDKVTIPAIVLIFLINLFLGVNWFNLILGAIIAGGFFGLQYKIPQWGRKIFGKKNVFFKLDWIGGGDIMLGILIGVMLGWKLTLMALFIAYTSGTIVSLGLVFSGKKKLQSKMPFGTFLSSAAIIALLWGDRILNLYDKIIGSF
jgi:prepilin signal peptidase PulO-like enzyme (type II secretory pathway)